MPQLLFLIVSFLSALGWLLTKFAVASTDPYSFLSVRFLIAAIILIFLCYRQLTKLSIQDIKRSLATGLLLGLQMIVWVTVVNQSNHLGLGAFIGGTTFIFISIVGACFFYAKIQSVTWFALGIVTFGLLLLNISEVDALDWIDVLFLLSAILYAVYFNVCAKYAAKIPNMPLTALQLLSASLLCGITGLLSGEVFLKNFETIWELLLAAALLASALRYYLQVVAQSYGNSTVIAIILTFDPIWVALMSYIWLEESFSTQKIIGCAIIFLGVLINTYWLFKDQHKNEESLMSQIGLTISKKPVELRNLD